MGRASRERSGVGEVSPCLGIVQEERDCLSPSTRVFGVRGKTADDNVGDDDNGPPPIDVIEVLSRLLFLSLFLKSDSIAPYTSPTRQDKTRRDSHVSSPTHSR